MMVSEVNALKKILRLPRGRSLTLDHTAVMGIINVTDDSFYEGSRVSGDAISARTREMLAAGADIIDIGAESTRPGSHGIGEADELARLIPAICELKKNFPDAVVSVDTQKPNVARESVAHGADIVNDISGGADGEAMRAAAEGGAAYVLMHIVGTPETMRSHAHYDDVLHAIAAFFAEGVERAESAGLTRDRIILDPGVGFAKNASHNLEILGNLDYFGTFGCPLLVGASRKGTIGKVLGLPDPADRLEGTLAITALAAWQGADIVRVHDVTENIRAARMADAVRRARR